MSTRSQEPRMFAVHSYLIDEVIGCPAADALGVESDFELNEKYGDDMERKEALLSVLASYDRRAHERDELVVEDSGGSEHLYVPDEVAEECWREAIEEVGSEPDPLDTSLAEEVADELWGD